MHYTGIRKAKNLLKQAFPWTSRVNFLSLKLIWVVKKQLFEEKLGLCLKYSALFGCLQLQWTLSSTPTSIIHCNWCTQCLAAIGYKCTARVMPNIFCILPVDGNKKKWNILVMQWIKHITCVSPLWVWRLVPKHVQWFDTFLASAFCFTRVEYVFGPLFLFH